MPYLTYHDIARFFTDVKKNTRNYNPKKITAFYKKITTSCDADPVLALLLRAYPPQGKEFVLFCRRARDLQQLQRNRGENRARMNVHDHIFGGIRNSTRVWLEEQVPALWLKQNKTPVELEFINSQLSQYQQKVIQLFEEQCEQHNLLQHLYPDAHSEKLADINKDFLAFIKYLFGSYKDRCTGADSMVRGLEYSLQQEDQQSALFLLFSSLNGARTGYEKDTGKYIEASHKYAQGKDRDWSCMPGVDERILDGLTPFMPQVIDNSIAARYVDALAHPFITKTADATSPSQLFYSLYVQSLLEEGMTCELSEALILKVQAAHELNAALLEQYATGYAAQQMNKFAALLKNLNADQNTSQEEMLEKLRRYKMTPSFGENSAFIKQVYDVIQVPTESIEESRFRFFKNQARARLPDILAREYENDSDNQNRSSNVVTELNTLVNQPHAFEVKEVLKPRLVFKSKSDGSVIEDFVDSIDNNKKEALLKFQHQSGLSELHAKLINDLFLQNGVDGLDACLSSLQAGRADIFVNEHKHLDTSFLTQEVTRLNKELLSLAKEFQQRSPDSYFHHYVVDEALLCSIAHVMMNYIGRDNFNQIPLIIPDSVMAAAIRFVEPRLLNKTRVEGLLDFLKEKNYTNTINLLLEHLYKLLLNKALSDLTLSNLFFLADNYGCLNVIEKLSTPKNIAQIALNEKSSSLDETALMIACKHGVLKMFEEILKLKHSDKIYLNQRDRYGNTGFMLACERGHLDIVQQFLKPENIIQFKFNEKNYSGHTALMIACKENKLTIVQELLKPKYNLLNREYKNKDASTAFILACQRGHLDIVQELLKPGHSAMIDINQLDSDGKTALMIACERGHLNIAQEFFKREYELDLITRNQTDNHGRSALHYAVINENKEMVEFLLRENASLSIKDNYDKTAFNYVNDIKNDSLKREIQDLLEAYLPKNLLVFSTMRIVSAVMNIFKN
jgi:ankyrin repeat protein